MATRKSKNILRKKKRAQAKARRKQSTKKEVQQPIPGQPLPPIQPDQTTHRQHRFNRDTSPHLIKRSVVFRYIQTDMPEYHIKGGK